MPAIAESFGFANVPFAQITNCARITSPLIGFHVPKLV
jgi:hypothetical protein